MDSTGVKSLLPAGMDIHYTLCGRTALELVLRDCLGQRSVHKAYLPSYCCHTMIEPFAAKGIQVEFYDVYFTDTGIGWDFCEDNGCDLVFLMDYFGFRSENTVLLAERQKNKGKCVVYDATHAMFCENMDYSACNYVLGSFRKWFGVNAGFCAKAGSWNNFPTLSQNDRYTRQRNAAFDQKQEFMAGKPVDKDAFLGAFSEAEASLETDYLGYGPDTRSLRILETVNVEFIRQRRRENAAIAIETLQEFSPYKAVKAGDCPLFVPLKVAPVARAALRRALIENRVYLPIHWPVSVLHKTYSRSQKIYDEELSFVCDQRYEVADMQRAAEIMRSFIDG